MTAARIEPVWAWLEAAARTWFRDPSGLDRLELDGLPAGDALHVEAFDRLVALTPRLGVQLRAPGADRLAILKRFGFDRAVRSWGLRAAHVGPRPSVRAPILFLSEIATPSTLEPSRCVADALPDASHAVATADPRATAFWRRSGRNPSPVLVGIAEQQQTLARARRLAATAWKEIERQPPVLQYAGADLWPDAVPLLRPLVLRSLPWLHVEHAAVRRTIEAVEPQWVVVATDQHRIGRLAAQLRPSSGHRLYVLQHGLPSDDIGYTPVVADRVAVWSDSSRDWFLRRGTAPERLTVLGNPRHDPLVLADRAVLSEKVVRDHGLSRRPRIVLAMSGIAEQATKQLVDLVLAALLGLPTASLIVKLHPGGGEGDAVRRAVRDLGPEAGRVRIVRHAPISPLLGWADIVVAHRTSVVLDALIVGTPVVTPRLAPGVSPGPEDLRLPEVADVAQLTEAIAAAGQNAGRAALLDLARADLERVAGPSDGRSAVRIARDLLGS
jgi:hypothetical protein